MSVRPPQSFRKPDLVDPMSAALEHEVMGEKVATYSRLNEKLSKALRNLADFDEQSAQSETVEQRRQKLVDRAATALWHVVIQRDLMRLPGTDRYLCELGVPAELRRRMGIWKR